MDRNDASPARYEAGNGLVLRHFASIATPEPKSAPLQWQRASVGANRAAAPFSTHAAGPRSVPRPNSGVTKRATKVFDDFVMDNQTESSDRSSELSAGTNGEPKSFAMSFSPPRHSPKKARRSNAESGSMTQSMLKTSSSGVTPAYRTEPNADVEMEEEEYSPVAESVEFLMSRDPEEDDRLMRSKSDRDKAFMYKKRYTDTYEHAVALLKHAATLDRERADKQSDLEYLRSTIKTQTQIINTMSDNQHLNEPTDYRQEKKIQALCREVTSLVTELGQRDSLIHSLHEERDRSARVIDKLRLSQGMNGSSSYASETMRSTDEFRGVERKLKAAIEEKLEALEREAKITAQLKELQQVYEKCEAQRSALANGLDQAEAQTKVLHAQWVKEKKELLASVAKDDHKSAGLSSECERLRTANEALNALIRQSSANEKKRLTILETQRQATEKCQGQISQQESELSKLRPLVNTLTEKEKRVHLLESDLAGSREKLRRCLVQVDKLEEQLEHSQKVAQEAKTRFQRRTEILERKMLDTEAVRRSLHNKVMELKGNIRVFCRVRPVLRDEFSGSRNDEIFSFPDRRGERRQIELAANPNSHVGYGQNGTRSVVKKYNFDFDLVLDSKCTQEDVFLEVSALIQSALDGYNVCIFAYGQTGSGKTYTMQGREEDADAEMMEPSPDMGIVGRAISHFFVGIDELRSSGWDFTASLELIEIYNETLRDLLAPVGSTDKVELRLDSDGKMAVMNSCTHSISNDHEAWSLLRKAMTRRSTKTTNMNDRSSRSHCIITFRLNGVNTLTGERRAGVINLVDLAGSERLSKSGSDSNKELMREALAINKSLSALGNVICALAKSPHTFRSETRS